MIMGHGLRATGYRRAIGDRLRATGCGLLLVGLSASLADAQATPQVSFAATSAHVEQPGSPVSIKILRWSTEEERVPVVAALNQPPPAAPTATPGADRGGAARGGRGGRGGRGRGEASVPLTPIAALTGALGRGPTLGYIWTDEVTGYAIKYAHRMGLPDGGERIVLATSRVLGAHSAQWKPVGGNPPTEYEFTVIELRLNSARRGEGKTSLTTKVIVDNEARTIALENYTAAPVMLEIGK